MSGSSPPLFDISAFLAQLSTKKMGRPVHYFPELDSTQSKAHELVRQGAEEGTVIIAEQQTAGRGRRGRTWYSPPGKGLWFSMVLKPELPISCFPQLTLLISVALCQTLRRKYGICANIKWPNDLIVSRKKVSGILLETSKHDVRVVIAGIGISVNLEEIDYPETLRGMAASLKMMSGRDLNREALLCAFLAEWEQYYARYHEQGFSMIKSEWERFSVHRGRPIVVQTAQGRIEGIAQGLDDLGALRVMTDDGRLHKLMSGDVIRY